MPLTGSVAVTVMLLLTAAALAGNCTERLVFAGVWLLMGSEDEGEKEHTAPVGHPVKVRPTVPLNALSGVSCKGKTSVCPAKAGCIDCDELKVKSWTGRTVREVVVEWSTVPLAVMVNELCPSAAFKPTGMLTMTCDMPRLGVTDPGENMQGPTPVGKAPQLK